MVELRIDGAQLGDIATNLGAVEKQATQALGSTLRRMAGWVRARSVKGLSGAAAVPQGIIRRRMRSFRVRKGADGSSLTLWYGLDPVALIYLKARKNRRGVSASGGRSVASGFIGKGQVFKRTGTARLPIKKQTAAIEQPSTDYLEGGLLGAEFMNQFLKTFERELTWRMRA